MSDDFTLFVLRGDHIALDALLKASGAASSGGDAKRLLLEGGVQVNGAPESRRGRKLRPGDRVVWGDAVRLRLVAADAPVGLQPAADESI